MAFNPSPKVADCRNIASKWGKQIVIIIGVNVTQGTLEVASFGQTKDLCDEGKRLADEAYDAIMQAYQVE